MKRDMDRVPRIVWPGLLVLIVFSLLTTFQVLAQEGIDDAADVSLQVNKDVSTGHAQAGDVLTYTISVTSSGSGDGVVAWLTDTVPAELALNPASVEASHGTVGVLGDDTVTWTEELPGGGYTPVITFSATISPEFTSGTIINTVQVTGTGELLQDTAQTNVSENAGLVYLPLISKRYPPIPELYPIDNGQGINTSYTVSWESIEISLDDYTLQESTSSNFDANLMEWQIAGTSRAFVKSSASATYYYRVRANNAATWGEGPWSNIETVSIWGYFDDFSDYESGWPREWSKTRGALYGVRPYEHPDCPGDDCDYWGDGYIIARRSGSNPKARFGPGVLVPTNSYEIEVDIRWWEAAYYATYQVFFASDNSFTDPENLAGEYYALQVRIDDNNWPPFCEYSLVRHDYNRQVETTIYLESWDRVGDINCDAQRGDWNHWRIVRSGSTITIFLNGDPQPLGVWTDSTYGANRYFGVGATLYEGFTPSKPEFDNFRVTLVP
jgi:uncharacterized repeat protein (TIGR01451 family)